MIVDRNISYRPGGKSKYHQLDIYRQEKNDRALPVILFIHGGGWRVADKEDPVRLHQNFCRKLSQQGFVVVAANYRLSPAVKHPVHVEDIAEAIYWVTLHIMDYGGDPLQLYLSGHSAGGHICAYLYTHPQLLVQKSIDPGSVKAFIGISGIYDLPEFAKWRIARDAMIKPAFGRDPEEWGKASPYYADSTLPVPMLLLNAEHDTGLEKQSMAMMEKFKNPLNRFTIIPGTSHFLVIAKFSPPVNIVEEIVGFMKGLPGYQVTH
jgi:acetyl esterase/lipase